VWVQAYFTRRQRVILKSIENGVEYVHAETFGGDERNSFRGEKRMVEAIYSVMSAARDESLTVDQKASLLGISVVLFCEALWHFDLYHSPELACGGSEAKRLSHCANDAARRAGLIASEHMSWHGGLSQKVADPNIFGFLADIEKMVVLLDRDPRRLLHATVKAWVKKDA
jgi:hypothetical protein